MRDCEGEAPLGSEASDSDSGCSSDGEATTDTRGRVMTEDEYKNMRTFFFTSPALPSHSEQDTKIRVGDRKFVAKRAAQAGSGSSDGASKRSWGMLEEQKVEKLSSPGGRSQSHAPSLAKWKVWDLVPVRPAGLPTMNSRTKHYRSRNLSVAPTQPRYVSPCSAPASISGACTSNAAPSVGCKPRAATARFGSEPCRVAQFGSAPLCAAQKFVTDTPSCSVGTTVWIKPSATDVSSTSTPTSGSKLGTAAAPKSSTAMDFRFADKAAQAIRSKLGVSSRCVAPAAEVAPDDEQERPTHKSFERRDRLSSVQRGCAAPATEVTPEDEKKRPTLRDRFSSVQRRCAASAAEVAPEDEEERPTYKSFQRRDRLSSTRRRCAAPAAEVAPEDEQERPTYESPQASGCPRTPAGLAVLGAVTAAACDDLFKEARPTYRPPRKATRTLDLGDIGFNL